MKIALEDLTLSLGYANGSTYNLEGKYLDNLSLVNIVKDLFIVNRYGRYPETSQLREDNHFHLNDISICKSFEMIVYDEALDEYAQDRQYDEYERWGAILQRNDLVSVTVIYDFDHRFLYYVEWPQTDNPHAYENPYYKTEVIDDGRYFKVTVRA